MNKKEANQIQEWLDDSNRSLDKGKELAGKHIRNRHLLKTINKSKDKAERLVNYHLQRLLNKFEEERAAAADKKYIEKEFAKPAKAKKKPEPVIQPEQAGKPASKPDGLTIENGDELTADNVAQMKKRAGDLSLQATMTHADMKKATSDADRAELAAQVVAMDNERREIWNMLEGKGKVPPAPDRVPSDAEKLAEIIRKGSLKTTKDSLKRAQNKLDKATTAKAKNSAQKSVDKYTAELKEINRLMGIEDGKAES